MKHYEIVVLLHPDHTEQIVGLVEHFKEIINGSGGVIHRFEDWGKRGLAYPIQRLQKAYYILMNIEISLKTLNDLQHQFHYRESVLRSLILRMSGPEVEPSVMIKSREEPRKTPGSSPVGAEGREIPSRAQVIR